VTPRDSGQEIAQKCAFSALARSEREWRIEKGGIHPRGDRKSAESIEKKRVARAPSSKRVRKRLKAKRLNRAEGKEDEARESDLGIRSGLELGKHGRE
jgi:hypothetical protein